MNQTSVLSIAETAEATGLTAHTLRYYERIGLVAVPATRPGGGATGPTRSAGSCSSRACG